MIEQFFAKAPKRFLNYAMSLTNDLDDANDIIQEAIISIWRSRENTHDLNDGYFRFVIKQKFVDMTRRRTKNVKLLLEAEPISHNDALTRLYLEELNKVVDSANPLHKEVFSMNMAGYKFREIADILNIPEGTALGAMRYIRAKIKSRLLNYSI